MNTWNGEVKGNSKWMAYFQPRFQPGSRDSFCLLEQGEEMEAPLELHQAFEVAKAQTSGLVKLVNQVRAFVY